MFDFPLLALLIKVTDRFGFERLPTGEHVVEDAGNFVCRGDDGFRGGTARTPGAVKGAKDGMGSRTGLGGLSEGLTSAVVDFHHAGAQHLATGNVVMGSQTEPGTEVLARGKAGHVGPDLRNDRLSERFGNTDDVDQIDAEDARQMRADIVGGLRSLS